MQQRSQNLGQGSSSMPGQAAAPRLARWLLVVVMKTWRLPSSCIRKRMVATAVDVSTMVTYVIHMATKNTNRLLATSLACTARQCRI